MTKGTESVTLGYDGSLPTSIAYAGIVNQTIATTFNNDFIPTSVTYAGAATAYAYDDDGLLTQAGAFTIARDAQNGLPTSVSDGTATMVPLYNGYGEVTTATTTVNGVNVAVMSLDYDNAGRITGKTETIGGNTFTYAYAYDAMSRLDTVTRNGILVEDYDYDAQGRRVEFDNALRGIVNRAAAYDDDDRLVTSGVYAYGFGDDGFLAAKTNTNTLETTTYAYARNGQLNSVTLPDETVIEYLHNAAGQRVAKKVNGVITEKYLWAGITGLLAVYDGSDNLLMRFEGGRMVKNGQTYYLVTDQVGTVRAVVDATGSIVKEVTYDSFGNILTDTAPAFTIPLGFAGGLHDRDTGLVRFGFRDYNPDTGTWTARDPLGIQSGLYLYLYCNHNPVGLSDPQGLKWGANVVGSAIGGALGSLGDSVLSIATLGYYGVDPLLQGEMYGGAGMVKAQKLLITGSAASLVTGLGVVAVAPGLAFAELGWGAAATVGTGTASGLGTVGGARLQNLIASAQQQYPKLTGNHWHHVVPRYLGGPKDGVQARIPAAYHQLITNAFRKEWAYGQGVKPSLDELERIIQRVYSQYPIDGSQCR